MRWKVCKRSDIWNSSTSNSSDRPLAGPWDARMKIYRMDIICSNLEPEHFGFVRLAHALAVVDPHFRHLCRHSQKSCVAFAAFPSSLPPARRVALRERALLGHSRTGRADSRGHSTQPARADCSQLGRSEHQPPYYKSILTLCHHFLLPLSLASPASPLPADSAVIDLL